MEKQNHNMKEYTLEEASQLVGRSAQTLRNMCNDKIDPIDHKRFGRTYVITELGIQQALKKIANAKPGPKGPRTPKPGTRARKPKTATQPV